MLAGNAPQPCLLTQGLAVIQTFAEDHLTGYCCSIHVSAYLVSDTGNFQVTSLVHTTQSSQIMTEQFHNVLSAFHFTIKSLLIAIAHFSPAQKYHYNTATPTISSCGPEINGDTLVTSNQSRQLL